MPDEFAKGVGVAAPKGYRGAELGVLLKGEGVGIEGPKRFVGLAFATPNGVEFEFVGEASLLIDPPFC